MGGCCFINCKNRSPHYRLFVFPADSIRRRQWIEKMGCGGNWEPGKNSRLCEVHFDDAQFEQHRKDGWKRLKTNAVPTMFVSSHSNISPVCWFPSEMVKQLTNNNDNQDVIIGRIDPNENEEDSEDILLEEHNVVEKVKASLCRVCGRTGDLLTPILEDSHISSLQGVPLIEVLEMYLPLQVTVDDSFPLNICSKCHDTLNEWHQFYVMCVAANETFKNIFGGGKDKEASCSSLSSSSVNEDTGVLPPRNDHNYVKDQVKETEKMQQDVENEDNISADDSDGLPVEESDEILSPVKLYFCKYCRQSHCNNIQLKLHTKVCKEEPTLCDKCGKILLHRKLLPSHMYKHQYMVRICDKCGISVPGHHFSVHCNTYHSGSYYCNLCCTILCSRTLYTRHMRKHRQGMIKSSFKIDPFQNDDGVDVYRCPVCEKLFNDLPTVIIHLNQRKALRCPTCGMKLNNEKRFAIHICRKWDCHFCQKTFYSREKLTEHIRIHTGEKPFKCHFCSASFRKKYQRFVHLKTHGAPSHECKYCSKRFKLATSLRNHINAHEGVFFPCPFCGKKFPDQRYLQRHMKTHEN